MYAYLHMRAQLFFMPAALRDPPSKPLPVAFLNHHTTDNLSFELDCPALIWLPCSSVGL